jgi:putative hydrolase of the HAD superfamily
MKKGVIFDLWNTLVFKKGSNLTTQIADYYGIPFETAYEWIRMSSLVRNKSDKYYYLQMICQAAGVEFEEKDKKFFDDITENYHKECEIIENAIEVVHTLKNNGFKVALLSNSSEISHLVIEKLGIKNLFDVVVISCDYGFLKPDPRIFQITLDKLELSNKEVVMIGDKITTDVLGAKMLDIDIIYFNKSEKKPISNPNVSFLGIANNLTQILSFLNINQNDNH